MGILYVVIKIPTTSPSQASEAAAYARCLDGKRLQRTYASQLRVDGSEKESAFLLLVPQLSRAHMPYIRDQLKAF